MKLSISIPILAFGAILSANKCAGPADATAHGARLSPGKWTLLELNGAGFDLPAGVERPYLQLDSAMERVNGYGGCNRMFGGIRIHGDSISFPMMGATKMYCEETHAIEDKFLQALNNTATYTVKDGQLRLSGNGTVQAVLQLEKTP
jgi:heat shock protein HslJ